MKLYHLSGAGNDFIALDARDRQLHFEDLAKSLCAKYGADGFLALDRSEVAHLRLHFYNRDGLRGELCGNGLRCACHLARLLGIMEASLTVETDAGLTDATWLGGDQYRTRLPLPSLVDLERRQDAAYVELGDPGIPHSLTELPRLDYEQKEALRPYALELRHDPAFPKGVNVNFYAMVGENRARLLTYERGVEDYTLACGTGSASLAVTLWQRGQLPKGRLEVENPGGLLTVDLTTAQSAKHPHPTFVGANCVRPCRPLAPRTCEGGGSAGPGGSLAPRTCEGGGPKGRGECAAIYLTGPVTLLGAYDSPELRIEN